MPISYFARNSIVIVPYKSASKGSKTLRSEMLNQLGPPNFDISHIHMLDILRKTTAQWNIDRSGDIGAPNGMKNITYINWGDSKLLGKGRGDGWELNNSRILNADIGNYTDKKKFFRHLSVYDFIPKIFTSITDAFYWVNAEPGRKLCVRALTQSSGGNGLSIYTYEDALNNVSLPVAPLYVEYKKKKHEFRYHFFKGSSGFLQQKRLRHGTENKNFEIRNHDNGWVFCRENVENITAVLSLCETLKNIAVNTWGLHFGAFDIIYNQSENKAYVLEINTAPGLEGQTATDYAKYFLHEHLRGTCGFNV